MLYHSHTHAHQPEMMLQLSRQQSSSRGSGKWGAAAPSGSRRESAASPDGGGGDSMATDPPLDFWPVDPSTLEDDNPLLRHDYTVIIGLNLVGACVWVVGDWDD